MAVVEYQKTQKICDTSRANEYQRLAELTGALLQSEKRPINAKAVANAVRDNQHFWSTLRIQLAHSHTKLPEELRLQFLSLAEWVEKESVFAASGDHPLEALIAVNRQIMEGLKEGIGDREEGLGE